MTLNGNRSRSSLEHGLWLCRTAQYPCWLHYDRRYMTGHFPERQAEPVPYERHIGSTTPIRRIAPFQQAYLVIRRSERRHDKYTVRRIAWDDIQGKGIWLGGVASFRLLRDALQFAKDASEMMGARWVKVPVLDGGSLTVNDDPPMPEFFA